MADTYYSDIALSLLKADLGHYDADLPPELETHLQHLLEISFHSLARAGIKLSVGEIYDDQLQAMYAAWMYRKGREGAAKPPMLQQEIRDRQVANAMATDEEVEA